MREEAFIDLPRREAFPAQLEGCSTAGVSGRRVDLTRRPQYVNSRSSKYRTLLEDASFQGKGYFALPGVYFALALDLIRKPQLSA